MCLRSVTSVRQATTPAMVVPSGWNSGCELTESHVKVPSGLCTPMITFEQGWPVRKVTTGGRASSGKGEPSSRIAPDRGSSGVKPLS